MFFYKVSEWQFLFFLLSFLGPNDLPAGKKRTEMAELFMLNYTVKSNLLHKRYNGKSLLFDLIAHVNKVDYPIYLAAQRETLWFSVHL